MSYVILILFFIVIPFLLGLFYLEENQGMIECLLRCWIFGFICLLGLFEIIYIPAYFLHASYHVLQAIYMIVVLGFTTLSVVYQRKKVCAVLKQMPKPMVTIPLLVAIVLAVVLTAVPAIYTNSDDDDAFYIATATTTQETNTMFRYSPYTGKEIIKIQDRYLLSPYPVFLANASSLSGMHVAKMAHRVIPIFFIPLALGVLYLFAGLFYAKDSYKRDMFFLLAVLLTMFSGYSIKNGSVFLLYRIWQGKAVLAAFLLPVMWYVYAKRLICGEKNIYFYTQLVLLSSAAGMVSSMGIFLMPILIGILSLVLGIYKKSIKEFVFALMCACPSVILGLIYLFVL